jgi:hypothetical protein
VPGPGPDAVAGAASTTGDDPDLTLRHIVVVESGIPIIGLLDDMSRRQRTVHEVSSGWPRRLENDETPRFGEVLGKGHSAGIHSVEQEDVGSEFHPDHLMRSISWQRAARRESLPARGASEDVAVSRTGDLVHDPRCADAPHETHHVDRDVCLLEVSTDARAGGIVAKLCNERRFPTEEPENGGDVAGGTPGGMPHAVAVAHDVERGVPGGQYGRG